jgi:predicted membrane-bound spermidine synthase
MAGLAAGNGLAARFGDRILRPLRFYALLEVAIGVTGVALVLLFPRLSALLAPWFRALEGSGAASHSLRLGIAFVLMMVPTAAMGATLPMAVKPLARAGAGFGPALGLLYGWNTLGAVAGALLGEVFAIGWLGIAGTGVAAAGMNVGAALLALVLSRRVEASASSVPLPHDRPLKGILLTRTGLLLCAGFLSGAILLALEVVWLRFLLLFVWSSALAFGLILAIALAGIGLGGLVAARVAAGGEGDRFAASTALLCGVALVFTYAGFDPALPGDPDLWYTRAPEVALLATLLMFPVAFGSGVLFTLLGQALHRHGYTEVVAAGWFTAANTLGAMLGALLAGLVLLPGLGMERSLFALALGYGVVGLLALLGQVSSRDVLSLRVLAPGAALGLCLVLFPFGATERHLEEASARFTRDGYRTVLVREGLSETLQLMQMDRYGEPLVHRLLTNGFSMSGSGPDARRYMKLYVYWPLALHPAPRRALLIGYGIGVTAEALVQSADLEEIHVVDRSREVLETSAAIFGPQGDPLVDPRVTSFVEDGRHFLQSTSGGYDLITAEPPPPAMRRVVNLYTREYFGLIRVRLNEGGMVTYWLPVQQMTVETTRSILRAFCDVFVDCALWEGSGYNWMMTGSRGATGPVSEARFRSQWGDPDVARALDDVGLELPELIGTTYLADGETLARWIADAAPVVDDRPKRLGGERAGPRDYEIYAGWADVAGRRVRFERSPLVRRLWPERLRRSTSGYFAFQPLLNIDSIPSRDDPALYRALDLVLDHSDLRTPVYWLLNSDLAEQQIIDDQLDGEPPPRRFFYPLAVRAIAERRYRDAADRLRPIHEAGIAGVTSLLAYSLCKADAPEEARAVAGGIGRAASYRCW